MNGNRNLSMQSKYGVSSPDFSAIDGMHQYEGPSTSRVFYGDSREKATRWTIDRASGDAPNAAYAGKGSITFDNPSAQQQPQM